MLCRATNAVSTVSVVYIADIVERHYTILTQCPLPLFFPEKFSESGFNWSLLALARQLALLTLARQLTLLALTRLARQLKPLDFLMQYRSSASSSAYIASASSARQLKSLDFPHAIPVNNIANTGTCLAAGPTVKEDTPSGQK